MAEKKAGFEQSMARLEEIVKLLERGRKMLTQQTDRSRVKLNDPTRRFDNPFYSKAYVCQEAYILFPEEANADTAFLSAEHLSDGTRTFKMIPHAPEQTSFGLELYDEVLGSVKNKDDEAGTDEREMP